MKLNNIAQKFKKSLFKHSSLYSNPVVELSVENEDLIVSCKADKFSSNHSILVQHRLTKKSIEKNLGEGNVTFSLDELISLGFFGYFDLYFKLDSDLVRIKNDSDKHIHMDVKGFSLKSYSTQYGNLSLNLEKVDFEYSINSITSKDDDIIILGDFDFINDHHDSEVYLEVKNRKSGKRLNERIKSNKIIFSLDEILSLDDSPYFDLYLKTKSDNIIEKKRIKYSHDFQFFKAISKNRDKILSVVSTNKNNLSFKQEKRYFDCNISSLKTNDNKLFIRGDVEILDDEIKHVEDMNIVSKNRTTQKYSLFDVDFKQENDSKYSFEGVIGQIHDDSEKIVNLRLDFYVRIYYDDIYYQNFIDLTNYTLYDKKENKFLEKILFKDNVYSFYATDNKHSLALWITTESSWNKSYEITKGKTIYDETARQFDIDDKMVFFESFFGKSYSGNPKYIYETMLELGMDKEYTFVWAYSGEDKSIIPGNPIIVDRYEAGDYYKYLAKAKYWVNNILFPIHKKRKGNVYLQTWHGTPLKKLGYDITIPGPEVDARKNFYHESRNWDYLISSNKYSSEIFKRAFKFNKEIIELGYPINDIFFRDNSNLIKDLKEKFGIDDDRKIILYAPTWKDDEQNASWEHYFNLEIDLDKLYDELGDDYVILLKMHHLVSENLKIDDKLKDFAVDVSYYDDIQELYVLSDILITDYSSVFFDYAHSRRPILFFVPDLEHYMSDVRGLYLNMKKDLPGPLIKDTESLINAIKSIDDVESEYADRYDEFYDKFCSLCNGKSGEDIVKKVFR